MTGFPTALATDPNPRGSATSIDDDAYLWKSTADVCISVRDARRCLAICTQVLHLAEGAAYNRIEAARAARSYPVILELFEQSAITLTAVRLLAPHLTMDNHAAVLAAATYKSKRQIEELVSSLFFGDDVVREEQAGWG